MSFADTISKDRGQPATVRIGVVVTVNPLTVRVQNTVLTNVGSLGGANLVVGDTVALLGQSAVSADGSSWLALGSVGAASTVGALTYNGMQQTPAPQSNATGGFTSIVGVQFQWRKLRTNSRVFIQIAGSAYSNATGNGAEFGLQFVDNAGVLPPLDFAIAQQFYNVALSHMAFAGFTFVAGGAIPAGSYTVNGRFRLYIVASSVAVDTNDRISVAAQEVD